MCSVPLFDENIKIANAMFTGLEREDGFFVPMQNQTVVLRHFVFTGSASPWSGQYLCVSTSQYIVVLTYSFSQVPHHPGVVSTCVSVPVSTLLYSHTCFHRFPITLEWNGKVVAEKVIWFQYESDVSLNSNVFQVAQGLVQKHFPGNPPSPTPIHTGRVMQCATLRKVMETTVVSYGVHTHRAAAAEEHNEKESHASCDVIRVARA